MTQLVKYNAARSALAEAKSVDEVKDVHDKAEAIRLYALKAKDMELVRWAAELKLDAERKGGGLLNELGLSPGNPQWSQRATNARLKDFGLTKSLSSRWQLSATVSDEDYHTWLENLKGESFPTSSALRKIAKRQAVEATETAARAAGGDTCTTMDLEKLQGRSFGTIYADPPWLYGNQATRAATSTHYNGMTVDEIAALPIADLAADCAHLHLWTTNAFIFEAKSIIEAWGFTYKSCLVWVKPQMGIGNYWRVSHEFLLLGVRGSCPFRDKSMMSWIQARRGRHSAKPEIIRHMIEATSPGPRLELFGRSPAQGWTVWGNEIERSLFHLKAAE